MTILMRRELGSGSPEMEVGGAWIPAKLSNLKLIKSKIRDT